MQSELGKRICLVAACVAVTGCSVPSFSLRMNYELDTDFSNQYHPERSELQGAIN